MPKDKNRKKHKSAFSKLGFKKTVDLILEEIKELYLADEIPWVIGYSGGKDSTATLQLVWLALEKLDKNKLGKPVHVISTDTLVENPIVAGWVTESLELMKKAANRSDLPITPHRLTPRVEDSFWVNLIGRGYPSPRPKFRWCTIRLKINPSNRFISNVVQESGETILFLGTRKAESAKRAQVMMKFEKQRTRAHLSPNASLPNCLVYTPIEEWFNDDVWLFLMQVGNPWSRDNKALLTMYQGASPDAECPLVVDTSTPSCGDSRFGCWVCTMVDTDRSMHAMIQNDEEKEWMLPLLELRDELANKDDRHLREFRRMSGAVQLFHDRPLPGPYKKEIREQWLRKLLEAQRWIHDNAPNEVRNLELITLPELQEIRRMWVVEKHEIEDNLPQIYKDTIGEKFPDGSFDESLVLGRDVVEILREVCGEEHLHFELTRDLMDIERRYRKAARRAGLYDALEQAFKKSFYTDEADALDRARRRQGALDNARKGEYSN